MANWWDTYVDEYGNPVEDAAPPVQSPAGGQPGPLQGPTPEQMSPGGGQVGMDQVPGFMPPMEMPPAAPAQEQAQGGGLMDFVTQAAGNLYANVPAFMPSVGGLIDFADTSGDMLANGAEMGSIGAGAASAIDMATLGNMDEVAAVARGMRAASQGASPEEAFNAYADQKEAINEGLQQARADHPIANIVGAVTGGIFGPGSAMIGLANKAGRAIPALNSFIGRSFTASAVAGGEVYAHGRFSGKDHRESAEDAKAAAIGTAFLYGAGSLISGGVRLAKGKTKLVKHEKEAARELMRALSIRGGKIDQNAVLDQLRREGGDNILADVYPELRNKLAHVVADPTNEDIVKDLVNTIRLRNDLASDFQTAVRDAVSVPRLRSPKEFASFIAARQARLKPQYDDIFQGARARGLKFKRNGVVASFTKHVEKDLSPSVVKDAKKELNRVLTSYGVTEKAGKGIKRIPNNQLELDALHNAKKDIYRTIRSMENKREYTGGMWAAYNYLDAVIASQSPKYARLSRTYGEAAQQQRAYDNGFKLFTKKGVDAQALSEFKREAGSYASVTAFTHGVRKRLVEELKNKSPSGVEKYLLDNQSQIDALKETFGEVNTQAILDDVRGIVERTRTEQAVKSAAGTSVVNQTARNPARSMKDMAMAALQHGSPAGQAAAGRLATDTGMTLPQLQARNAITADVAGAPIGDIDNIVNMLNQTAVAGRSGRTAGGAAGAGLGLGAAAGAGMAPDEPQPDSYDWLEAYRQGGF